MQLRALIQRPSMTLWAFLSLFALAIAPALAQDGSPPPVPQEQEQEQEQEDLGPMEIEIDLDRLLFDSARNSSQDPVWRFYPSSGKEILLIPFTVDNIHRANSLSRFPYSVRAARFIGFVIPKPDQTDRSVVDLNQVIRAAPDALQAMLFDRDDEAQAGDFDQGGDPDEDKAVPDSAPRLARDILLHPDGSVQWSMARSFQAAELQRASEQNPYAYKIDPQQLREAQPERAERLTRNQGEDSREFAQRKRDQQEEEREKQNAYRELRNGLRELPETFREARPSVLYAAMEVNQGDSLSFEGPAPMPWAIDPEKKELLDNLSRGRNLFNEEGGEDLAGRVITMIEAHPLDARSIAIATQRSNLASNVEVDGPGYKVLSQLLQSKDVATRRIALYGVATVSTTTLASAELLGVAGEAVLGEERKMLSFASLGKLFSMQADDPAQAQALIGRVNETIADPEGPAAPRIVEKVLDALEPDQSRGGLRLDQAMIDVMVQSIDLSGVESDEVAGVVDAVVKAAPTNAVAAGWLDRKLLGSTDREVVNQTLSVLYESQLKLIDPNERRVQETDDAAPAPETGALVLHGTIPIRRADHALLGLFESGDDVQSAATWAVLGKFHIALPKTDGEQPVAEGEEPFAGPALSLFDSILAMAGEREKMPASVVAFLTNQQDSVLAKPANDRLVKLLTDPDLVQKTALAAVDAYTASPDRYRESVTDLEVLDQLEMLAVMYKTIEQEPPLMSGLIGDNGSTLGWFNAFVTEQGVLPNDQDWAERALSMGEGTLLQAAGSSEPSLAAAAAAALVLAAGGDLQQQQAFAQTVAFMEARTQQQVEKAWEQQRGKIFAAAFERARGTYKLVATLGPFQDADPQAASDEPAAGTRVELGLIEFQAEGLELSLSVEAVALSPTPGELGIRINQGSALRSFDKPELSSIPPEHLSKPIDLTPAAEGVWSGQTRLPDGRTFTVTLESEG
ncbi:MAG: hypothetical protein AAGB26_11825 [Planctomycetota bacterium]